VKNGNVGQKTKLWLKIEILAKKRNFGQKMKKIPINRKILLKIENVSSNFRSSSVNFRVAKSDKKISFINLLHLCLPKNSNNKVKIIC